MKKDEIISTLKKKIAVEILNFPQKQIETDEALISSGLIDSFSLVDLALLIEDTYDVRIEDTELNSDVFDTLGQLAEIVISRIE